MIFTTLVKNHLTICVKVLLGSEFFSIDLLFYLSDSTRLMLLLSHCDSVEIKECVSSHIAFLAQNWLAVWALISEF